MAFVARAGFARLELELAEAELAPTTAVAATAASPVAA
jgi:hypothetical protein